MPAGDSVGSGRFILPEENGQGTADGQHGVVVGLADYTTALAAGEGLQTRPVWEPLRH